MRSFCVCCQRLSAYTACYPLDKTWQGKVRQRKLGGGAKGLLSQMEDKLLFILVYQKTNPLRHCQVVGDDIVTRQQQALSGCDCHRPDA